MINNGEEECSYSSSDESSQVVPLENRLQLESEWFQKARASSTIEQVF